MNCRQAQSLLYEVIDNEASKAEIESVKAHLCECTECNDQFIREQSLHVVMVSKCREANQAECACDRFKAKISQCLNEAEAEERTQNRTTQRPPFRVGRYVLAAAAVLALVIGAVYITTKVSDHQSTFAPIERLHWASAENRTQFTEANAVSASSGILTDFNYELQPTVGEFQLIGNKLDTLEGVPMQHFVYSNEKTLVSVFVVSMDKFTMPDGLEKAKVVRNGMTFFDHNCRGCRVVYHQEGKAMIITATTDHSIELLDFIPGRVAI